MTNTSGIETTTWFDQRPSHRPVSPAVRAAEEHYSIARKVYDEAVDYYLDNGEWDQPHLDDLAHIVDEAYKDMLEAKHDALNPCPHKHVSMVGGQHFAAGDVWDDIQEVCDDCGMVLSEGGE